MSEIDALVNHLPTKYLATATFIWVLIQSLGRAWHGWKAEGGWRGIRDAWLFGTNTPNEKSNTPDSK